MNYYVSKANIYYICANNTENLIIPLSLRLTLCENTMICFFENGKIIESQMLAYPGHNWLAIGNILFFVWVWICNIGGIEIGHTLRIENNTFKNKAKENKIRSEEVIQRLDENRTWAIYEKMHLLQCHYRDALREL